MQSTHSGILRHVYRIYVYMYICILNMYMYQCIFIFFLKDHDNDLFYSEFYPFINSSTLHWGGKPIICDRSFCIKGSTRYLSERQSTRSICIYIPTCTTCFLYFFETLHDTCRYVYIIICWSRDTNNFSGGQFGMKYFWGTGEIGYVLFTCPSRTHMFLFLGTGICGFSLWRLMLKALLVFSAG